MKYQSRSARVMMAGAVLSGVILVVLLVMRFSSPEEPAFFSTQNVPFVQLPPALDRAVSDALFAEYGVSVSDLAADGENGRYAVLPAGDVAFTGECAGEGHLVLDFSQTQSRAVVCLMGEMGTYRLINGCLVGGCSTNPGVLTFDRDAAGGYTLHSIQRAKDGDEFTGSVGRMFTKKAARLFFALEANASTHNETAAIANESCRRYAEAYLRMLGREAEIGDYGDFDLKILSDYGVSAEADNELLSLHPEYGLYVGSCEERENGRRVVYEQKWDGSADGTGTVTFRKYDYETGKEIERFVYYLEKGRLVQKD